MRILIKSVEDAFLYVMEHYAPAGMEELADRTDTYAVISVQDTHLQNFGFVFTENKYCKGVLTIYVDDIVKPVEGAVLFSEKHARLILDFVEEYREKVDTLLIHCYAGSSRSAAIGKALLDMESVSSQNLINRTTPNEHIYQVMMNTGNRKNIL